ncbi:MAG: polysaccharide deacetylase [Bacteroidetes bacterium]|nr:polysaccharide deacetylase [Bacteroidota bacterium]
MNNYNTLKSAIYRTFSLVLLIIVINSEGKAQSALISNYQVYIGTARKDNIDLVILRKFSKNNQDYFVLVDPNSLDTKISFKKECNSIHSGFDEVKNKFAESPYFRSLNESKDSAKNIQDAGITHGLPKEAGINLTIDLCPSRHPLNSMIFTTLINTFQNIQRPIPVAIAISGRWILEHPRDLIWLKQLQQKGDINICWINHSLNHKFDKNLPLQNNFMLMNATNVKNEILGNEQLMIQNGLMPSVFFRFPGLISDNDLLNTVYGFGLITIGSDAWLAKGNPVNEGSIVLIHGNGNEAIGVSKFLNLLISKKTEEKNKSWLLYDLRQSLEEEFKNN